MLSNTSSSGLQIVGQSDVSFVELQPVEKFVNSYSNNNNNNNNMSTDNKMSSFERIKPFTYYTSGVSSVDTSDCTPIIVQCSRSETNNSSNSLVNNKLTANFIDSNQCFTYEPNSLYNSKQEELTKKVIDNFRNDKGRIACKNDGSVVTFTSMKNKITSDTSSNCSNSNSNSSNSSSKSSKSDRQKSPMCRTEDQENAFRQIKVVHNYSKSNRYEYCNGGDSHDASMYSSNSSNQDEDEDDEDGDEDELEDEIDYEHHYNQKVRTLIAIERQKNSAKQSIETQEDISKTSQGKPLTVLKMDEDENKSLPDHHARRPMNAFLIFCKRHRGIVKEKYKNYENRSITKILGEWWASLDQTDKAPYVSLAKQNKDAFFSANPNFKWYKLPAPSLRTLNTRPGNAEKPIPISSDYHCDLNDSRINQDQISCSQRGRLEPKREYFKLADETQMGELNNLMRPLGMTSSSDALQDALGETSDYFRTVCKRKCSPEIDAQIKIKKLNNENGCSSSEEDILPKKSSRSCKGKKYQELMNSGQITPVTPKRQLPSKSYAMSNSNEDNQIFTEYTDHSKTPPAISGESLSLKQKVQLKEVKEDYEYSDCCETPVKQGFGYVSFDLDDKIKALPAQCLETYLQRKKNTKRKKKINSKKRTALPKASLPSKTVQSQLQKVKTAQEAREQMVGSQKRKARKESITRRDINSIQNEVQLILCTGSNDTNILVSGVSASESSSANQGCTSDLLILAEVAANHTGIAKI